MVCTLSVYVLLPLCWLRFNIDLHITTRQSKRTARQLTLKQIDSDRHRDADRGNERAASLISEIATLECPHPTCNQRKTIENINKHFDGDKPHKPKDIYISPPLSEGNTSFSYATFIWPLKLMGPFQDFNIFNIQQRWNQFYLILFGLRLLTKTCLWETFASLKSFFKMFVAELTRSPFHDLPDLSYDCSWAPVKCYSNWLKC